MCRPADRGSRSRRTGSDSSGRRPCRKTGATGYLFGEIRDTGWRHYYLVTLAVKVPLAFWLILALRAALARRIPSAGCDWVLPAAAALFLVIASLGSTRNMGIRYLLPIAPLAIIWVSGLAEGTAWVRRAAWGGLAALAVAIASIHPYELSYFNVLAGGPIGGRRILSDSNLDWSQGLKPLAELQRDRPELRDLTLFYFGDTEADRFGVAGPCLHGASGQPERSLAQGIRTRDSLRGRVGLAPMGALGAAGLLPGARRCRAGLLHRRHHDRDLPDRRPSGRSRPHGIAEHVAEAAATGKPRRGSTLDRTVSPITVPHGRGTAPF